MLTTSALPHWIYGASSLKKGSSMFWFHDFTRVFQQLELKIACSLWWYHLSKQRLVRRNQLRLNDSISFLRRCKEAWSTSAYNIDWFSDIDGNSCQGPPPWTHGVHWHPEPDVQNNLPSIQSPWSALTIPISMLCIQFLGLRVSLIHFWCWVQK